MVLCELRSQVDCTEQAECLVTAEHSLVTLVRGSGAVPSSVDISRTIGDMINIGARFRNINLTVGVRVALFLGYDADSRCKSCLSYLGLS